MKIASVTFAVSAVLGLYSPSSSRLGLFMRYHNNQRSNVTALDKGRVVRRRLCMAKAYLKCRQIARRPWAPQLRATVQIKVSRRAHHRSLLSSQPPFEDKILSHFAMHCRQFWTVKICKKSITVLSLYLCQKIWKKAAKIMHIGKDNAYEITLWNTNLKMFLCQKAAKIMHIGKDNAGKDKDRGL